MIDFGNVMKFVYFPNTYHRTNTPYVIHVIEKWGNDWKGNPNLDELLAGKFSFYPILRCQPYSDELWEACQELVTRRTQLDADFERLMTKGLREA